MKNNPTISDLYIFSSGVPDAVMRVAGNDSIEDIEIAATEFYSFNARHKAFNKFKVDRELFSEIQQMQERHTMMLSEYAAVVERYTSLKRLMDASKLFVDDASQKNSLRLSKLVETAFNELMATKMRFDMAAAEVRTFNDIINDNIYYFSRNTGKVLKELRGVIDPPDVV